MKVAFIVGPSGAKYGDTYYDKVPVTKARPWLMNIDKKYWITDSNKKWNPKMGKAERYVRLDNAVALLLKTALSASFPDTVFKIINATELSFKKLEGYDLIINQFMDELIIPHIEKLSDKGEPHAKLRRIYKRYADKLYPPASYANLVYDKCQYYSYLKYKKIPTAPSYCVNITQNLYSSKDKFVKSLPGLVDLLKKKKWSKIFAKPVHGTDSKDVALFDSQDSKLKGKLLKYMLGLMGKKRYPKVVFQKFMEDFETTQPQIRSYWLGDRLLWIILNKNNTEDITLTAAELLKQFPKAMILTKRVLKAITPLFHGGPKFITRIDLGCCLEKGKKNTHFVNEIEFNPGMYAHLAGHERGFLDVKMVRQLIKVVLYRILHPPPPKPFHKRGGILKLLKKKFKWETVAS